MPTVFILARFGQAFNNRSRKRCACSKRPSTSIRISLQLMQVRLHATSVRRPLTGVDLTKLLDLVRYYDIERNNGRSRNDPSPRFAKMRVREAAARRTDVLRRCEM